MWRAQKHTPEFLQEDLTPNEGEDSGWELVQEESQGLPSVVGMSETMWGRVDRGVMCDMESIPSSSRMIQAHPIESEGSREESLMDPKEALSEIPTYRLSFEVGRRLLGVTVGLLLIGMRILKGLVVVISRHLVASHGRVQQGRRHE